MTIRDALQSTTIDRLDAELLLAFVLGEERAYVKAHPDHTLKKRQSKKFFRLASAREAHIPLAYILGHKHFFGHTFFVNKHTLVPRPETELLVELVLDDIHAHDHDTCTLIDVGTGSGCIPIACHKAVTEKKLNVFATDASKKAIKTAKKNAALHRVPITYTKGHLLDPVFAVYSTPEVPHPLLITANLPYLTHDQHASEDSISQEPVSALVADEEGLALYRELLIQLASWEHDHMHSSISLYFEIDPTQTDAIHRLVHAYFPTAHIQIFQDLAYQDRVLRAIIS